VFIGIACVLAFPNFIPEHPYVLKNFLLCIYGSVWDNPAVDGVGATWFVFTLMWLYFLVPGISYLSSKIKKSYMFFLTIGIFLFIGEVWRYYTLSMEMDWFHYVYTPPYSNAPMFISGVIWGYYIVNCSHIIKKTVLSKMLKIFSLTALVIAVLVCTYMFYVCGISHVNEIFWQKIFMLYKYSFQSLMAILVMLYLYSFNVDKNQKYDELTLDNVIKNPLRLIDSFATISFEFYLIHSLILNRICEYLRDPFPVQEFLKLFIATFIISTGMAYLFKNSIRAVYQSMHLNNPIYYYLEDKKRLLFLVSILLISVALIMIIIHLPY
jgi:peptidoglycan/LPS O-acetylase OafA/YrhL